MRKLFLLFALVGALLSFNACSDDDKEDIDNGKTEGSIKPPKWLHGEWQAEELGETHKFEFTSDNFLFTQINVTYDFAKIAKQDYNTVKEITNTDTEYRIDRIQELVGTGQTATDSFKFVKDSEGQVTFYLSGMGVNPVGIKLTKIK